ncbi:hypothetical protein M2132_000843 [Dysgonomonas sp. PH5-45]|uniref:carbohydrate-binding domain-containing protein n=1 Tax=unclassified Dysgonomonas TaxID=2630389 RepID=UPI0024742093|nr:MULTISPECIES: carbohydrate-binding domain-containing protein [unclassified Dysgonomonas]MDH6354515.1 hypothetical protein [Dysgonomonas sp. PH5-45]MDH6387429.1 hypothetical protein [Dysgonomonas sp. PH5-37]
MKKTLSLIICLIFGITLFAQDSLYVYKTDQTVTPFRIAEVDSLRFSQDAANLYIVKTDQTTASLSLAEVDSITFWRHDVVSITYSNGTASIVNPLAGQGVEVEADGARVTVTSTIADKQVRYLLNGTTPEGMFKIYSDYKFELALNAVEITNPNGAAINIQSGKKVTVTLIDGTTSCLTDGAKYTATPDGEDEKSTFFSEGQLNFKGQGTLNLQAYYKHAICSDDYIRIKSGNIIVTGAAKDGLHCNDYFRMDGGTLTITSEGDALEVEEGYIEINGGTINVNAVGDGLKTSYKGTDLSPYIEVAGGTIDVTVTGDASKAIKSKGDVTIGSGNITLQTTGNAYYDTDDADTSSSAGIKCDGNLLIENGNIGINSSGSGGKGINVDGTLHVKGGNISVVTTGNQYVYDRDNDTAAKAIKSDGNLTIDGGYITIQTSRTEAEGLESKDTLTINDGTIVINAYDDAINASNHIQINGGKVYSYSATNDGIDSNGTLTITGGIVFSSGTTAPEEGFDCDQNAFKITGGILIGTGGATSTPTSNLCTQQTVVYSTSGVTAGQMFHLRGSDAAEIVSVKVPRAYNSMTMLISTPHIAQGTGYTIYKNGTMSDDAQDFQGLYTSGTYTPGTSATTFTTSTTSRVTNVGASGGGPGGGPGGHP